MAESVRNRIRMSARDVDPTELTFDVGARAYQGFQPFGNIVGKQHGVDNSALIQRLGTDWILTAVTVGGSATNAVQAPTATLPPFVRLTTGTTGDDDLQLQHATPQTAGSGSATAFAQFVPKAGFNIHMKARFQLTTTVADAAMLIGLASVDTTLFASSVLNVNDFIGFYKPASTAMKGILVDDASSATTGVGINALTLGGSAFTPTINTWYDLDMYINGRTNVTFWVNGESVSTTDVTKLPDAGVALCLSAGINNGASAAATLELQVLTCHQEAF